MAGESYAGHATSIRGLGARAEARAAGPTTLQRMRTIMESGEQRFVGKGSEYDQPYYRQTGVPGTYTDAQQIEFSKLAQSLTYEDIARPATRRQAAFDLTKRAGERYGSTDKLSPQDLHNFLREWKYEAGQVESAERRKKGIGFDPLTRGLAFKEQLDRQRAANKGVPYTKNFLRGREPGSGKPEWDEPIPGRPTTSSSSWGDPRDLVRQGANLEASQAFREGTSGPPIAVDPFKGVDTRPKHRAGKDSRPSSPPPGRTTEPGGAFAKTTASNIISVEGQREGKRRAGKRYRRSRAGALTQQPTAGTILGDATGAGVLG